MTVVLSDITDSGPVPGRSVDLVSQLYLMQSDAKVLSVYTPAHLRLDADSEHRGSEDNKAGAA